MPKIKIELPDHFSFTTVIPIRITDLNYGGHVGNDSILSLLHEARVQFLRHYGYVELDLAGVGLIMSDVTIEFKNEIFYGESLRASVAAGEFFRVGFELFYKLEKFAGKGIQEDSPFRQTANDGPSSELRQNFVPRSDSLGTDGGLPMASFGVAGGKWVPVVFARTGMICYNYALKKVVSVPGEVISKLTT